MQRGLLMDWSKLKDVTESFKNIFVILAMLATGIWTIMTFDILLSPDKAGIELKKLTQEIRSRAIIQVHLDTKIINNHADIKLLIGTIKINNSGSRDVVLDVDDAAISIEKIVVDLDKSHVPSSSFVENFGIPHPAGGSYTKLVVRAGQKWSVPFIYALSEAGVYRSTVAVRPTGPDAISLPRVAGGELGGDKIRASEILVLP